MMKEHKFYRKSLIGILLCCIGNYENAIALQTNATPPCNASSFIKRLCVAATPLTIAAIALAITLSKCSLPTCLVASGGIVGLSMSIVLLILLCGNCIYQPTVIQSPIIV